MQGLHYLGRGHDAKENARTRRPCVTKCGYVSDWDQNVVQDPDQTR